MPNKFHASDIRPARVGCIPSPMTHTWADSRMLRLVLVFGLASILLFLTMPRAGAEDRPILVLRLESELGYSYSERRVGLSGAVYSLSGQTEPPDGTAHVQSLQVAYNAENRAVLARLVQNLSAPEDTAAFVSATDTMLDYLMPGADVDIAAFSQSFQDAAMQFLESGSGSETQIALSGGPAANLTFIADGGLAVLDLPILTPPEERLSASHLNQAMADATVEYSTAQGDPIHRYHAPNGGYAETGGSGTWEVDDQGRYCVERAPTGERRCSVIFKVGDDAFVEVRADGAGQNPEIRPMRIAYGNPHGLAVPRLSDGIATAVAKMILPGRTEQRRRPNGGIDRLYLDTDGSVRGEWANQDIAGQWTVLDDGRRCLTLRDASGWMEAECAFLSETDGGTYRLYDGLGTYLGEALYMDGNQNDF